MINTVNPENSIKYYEALLRNKVPAEMHIFQNGGHGFGTHLLAKNNWMDMLKELDGTQWIFECRIIIYF